MRSTHSEDIVGKKWGAWLQAPLLRHSQSQWHRQSSPQSDDDREASEPNLVDSLIPEDLILPVTVEGEHSSGGDGPDVLIPNFVERITTEAGMFNSGAHPIPSNTGLSYQESNPLLFEFENPLTASRGVTESVPIVVQPTLGEHDLHAIIGMHPYASPQGDVCITNYVGVLGAAKVSTWKKRAHASRISKMGSVPVRAQLGKRDLDLYEDTEDGIVMEPKLKKRLIEGNYEKDSFISVAIVEQPCQSQ
ncbi:hypothetical protein FCV25MIE_34167 [Fagus crenata]